MFTGSYPPEKDQGHVHWWMSTFKRAWSEKYSQVDVIVHWRIIMVILTIGQFW